jgi:hypothetical protein
MRKPGNLIVAALLICGLLLISPHMYSASPARDGVLKEVEVGRNDGNLFVEVQFSFPLRYLSHFPEHRGEELRIRLQPVRVPPSEAGAALRREGLVPRYADVVALDEVVYEGDIEGGPYLTLRFNNTASYEVIPGPDYRSVRIMVLSSD